MGTRQWRLWALALLLPGSGGRAYGEFDPPRIMQVVHAPDGRGDAGSTEVRICYISQGVEGNVNRGDELNVYRELSVRTRDGRMVRIFIGTMHITESQTGLSIGRFTPVPDLGTLAQVRYKTALKNDIVMPKLVINATALFDPGKTDLKPGVAEEFRKVGEFVENLAPARVVIEGHTDSDGEELDNQLLSERRAQTVRQYLIETYKFISPGMIQAKGLGESRPLVNNDTPENKALNRRIEIVVWE
jgi:outer membrane protein OmpA-like peptidoglycan-associated protein